jgi:hypothetical protein
MAEMRVCLLAAFLVVALEQSGAAAALSISNRDDHDHKITIVEGQKSTDHVLKPDAMIENVCSKGCIIRLNDSPEDEYELEGNEVVSIEEGNLYYDGPDAPASPPADAGKAGDGKGAGQKK